MDIVQYSFVPIYRKLLAPYGGELAIDKTLDAIGGFNLCKGEGGRSLYSFLFLSSALAPHFDDEVRDTRELKLQTC